MSNDRSDFSEAYSISRNYSLLGEEKSIALFSLAWSCRNVEGNAIELGTYRGGSAFLIAKAIGRGHKVGTIDTLTGMPMAYFSESVDGHIPGTWADVSPVSVRQLCDGYNIELIQGVFPDEVEDRINDRKWDRLAFAHYDGDTLMSCSNFMRYAWPRISPGGILLIDDYEWHNCVGVKQAFHAFDPGDGVDIIRPSKFQIAIQKPLSAKRPSSQDDVTRAEPTLQERV